jgi:hypothetical protein
MRFSQKQVNMSQRRRKSLIHQKEGRNLRAAIEGTVHPGARHPFPVGKLPVARSIQGTSMMIKSARAGDGEHFPYTTLPGSEGKGGKQANEVNE